MSNVKPGDLCLGKVSNIVRLIVAITDDGRYMHCLNNSGSMSILPVSFTVASNDCGRPGPYKRIEVLK